MLWLGCRVERVGQRRDADLRYKAAGGDNWTTVSDVTSGHVLNGLTPNTTYKVKVIAKNSVGASAWSDKGKGTTNT